MSTTQNVWSYGGDVDRSGANILGTSLEEK